MGLGWLAPLRMMTGAALEEPLAVVENTRAASGSAAAADG